MPFKLRRQQSCQGEKTLIRTNVAKEVEQRNCQFRLQLLGFEVHNATSMKSGIYSEYVERPSEGKRLPLMHPTPLSLRTVTKNDVRPLKQKVNYNGGQARLDAFLLTLCCGAQSPLLRALNRYVTLPDRSCDYAHNMRAGSYSNNCIVMNRDQKIYRWNAIDHDKLVRNAVLRLIQDSPLPRSKLACYAAREPATSLLCLTEAELKSRLASFTRYMQANHN